MATRYCSQQTVGGVRLSSRGRAQLVLLCKMVVCTVCLCSLAKAEDQPGKPQVVKHQITGLFAPEREQDLRVLFNEKLPQFKLVSVDYPNAEASFEYDPATVFPGANPEQVIQRFNDELRKASRSTFGAKPLRTTRREKLTLVEIPIVGLDCQACSLAAYESVYQLPGLELATASFAEGKVTVWIDPEKIDRAAIEMALKTRGVTIGSSPK